MNTIVKTIKKVRLGAPENFERLTVYPLLTEGTDRPDYLLPSEAPKPFEVSAVQSNSHAWRCTNLNDVPIIVLDPMAQPLENGSALASQALRVHISTLIPERSTLSLPKEWGDSHRFSTPGLDLQNLEQPVAGQTGVLCVYDGEVMGLDLFDDVEILRAVLPELLAEYAASAQAVQPARPTRQRQTIERFFGQCTQVTVKPFESSGVGVHFWVEGPALVGHALTLEKQLVHLSIFRSQVFCEFRNQRARRQSRAFFLGPTRDIKPHQCHEANPIGSYAGDPFVCLE